MLASYDFVVVGSGSSGAVVATRLSQNGKYSVALLEAGTAGSNHLWSMPPAGMAWMIEDPKVNWCRYTQPCESLAGRTLYAPAGKLLGGTSALNGMIYNRGQSLDYDAWAEGGCEGWSYKDLLPYFKKIECTDIGSDEYRGRHGPIKVTWAEKMSPFYDLFIQTAQAAGLPLNPDYSGASQYGVSMAQHTVYRGLRNSTATQYLRPARHRRNLTIVTGAEATSLIMEGTRCVGVRFLKDGAAREVRVRHEVIVSAGAVATPKLLELSGIGNPEILARYGIAVVRALPGVGENLRDHFGPTMQWRFSKKGYSIAHHGRGWRLVREVLRYVLLRKGFIAQGWATMRVFTKSHPGIQQADIALLANPYLIEVQGKKRKMSPIDGFFLFAQVQRPESAGSVHIQSADPQKQPAIHVNFLGTERDRRIAILAVRRAREIAATAPLADVIEAEILPGPGVQSDDEILDFIRRTAATTFHHVGTCKMGRDAMSVVDPRLRVHGITGLRIADASIMPNIISGNTSIPCMMIGEKCADLILADVIEQRPTSQRVQELEHA